MAKQKSTAVSHFTPKHNPENHPAVKADQMIERERLQLLSRVNHRASNYDTAEHIAEVYKLIGLNLAQSQLRMSF
jgi:hypothetical protein